MQRADEPGEKDDSKETSIVVVLPETDLTDNVRTQRVYHVQKKARNPRGRVHEKRDLGIQEMISDDNEANGRGNEDEDEDEDLEEETDEESEEHVSEEITEREEDSEHGREKRPKRAKTAG